MMEVQSGLYMLRSKLGWILSGRTSEIIERAVEPNMLILTHDKGIESSNNILDLLGQITTHKTKSRGFLEVGIHRYK